MERDPFSGESELWHAFRQGDPTAFAALYDQFVRPLLSYGRKLSSDTLFVEDTVHDLFMDLWRSRANLGDTTSIRFYLLRALRNKINRNRPAITPPVDADDRFELAELPFESLLIDEETAQYQLARLRQAVGQLTHRQQEVIHLRYFQQFDNQQVAELMQIDNQSVRNLLHSALRSLRQLLVGGLISLLLALA